jgi:O-antigen ligase
LPYNIIISSKNKKKVLRNVIIVLALDGVLAALLGASTFFKDFFTKDLGIDLIRVQPIKLFGEYLLGANYNSIVEILLASIFMVYSLKYFFKVGKKKRIINIFIILMTIVLLLTFSRGGWIAIALQIFIYLYLSEKIKKAVPIMIISFLLAIPLVFSMFILVRSDIAIDSDDYRMSLNRIAWQSFREKPLLGHGSGSFVSLTNNDITFIARHGAGIDSHGVWQKILAENGILGVMTFLIFISSIFYKAYEKIKNEKDLFYRNELLIPLVMAGLGVFLFEFVDTRYYTGQMWMPICIFLVTCNINFLKKNETRKI